MTLMQSSVSSADEFLSSANAVTGLFGLSGSGKSRQADEAARDVAARHKKITRMVVPDLGGWGNSRYSLIDNGVCEVYCPINHVEPFATMELLSQGWWPESFVDKRNGLAASDVAFVAPQTTRWVLRCANDHEAVVIKNPAQIATASAACPTCQVAVTAATCLRIDKQVVQTAGFGRVGLRVFDSMTQLNEWGLADRANIGATIAPGAADAAMRSALAIDTALPEGRFVFGTNDRTHYGFLQTRSRGWIANIRGIPGQVERAILTFGVETSKGDDESGGSPIYGPKIAGNARTSSVPGWLGNCFHLENNGGVFRIWLTSHPDGLTNIPYLAKHRGDPGLPAFLEDREGEAPFTTCSLREFYRLERAQLGTLREADAALSVMEMETADTVITSEAQIAPPIVVHGPRTGAVQAQGVTGVAVAGGNATLPRRPSAARTIARPGVPTGVAVVGTGVVPGRTGTPASVPTTTASATPAETPTAASVAATPPADVVQHVVTSPLMQQLEASLAAAGVGSPVSTASVPEPMTTHPLPVSSAVTAAPLPSTSTGVIPSGAPPTTTGPATAPAIRRLRRPGV